MTHTHTTPRPGAMNERHTQNTQLSVQPASLDTQHRSRFNEGMKAYVSHRLTHITGLGAMNEWHTTPSLGAMNEWHTHNTQRSVQPVYRNM